MAPFADAARVMPSIRTSPSPCHVHITVVATFDQLACGATSDSAPVLIAGYDLKAEAEAIGDSARTAALTKLYLLPSPSPAELAMKLKLF